MEKNKWRQTKAAEIYSGKTSPNLKKVQNLLGQLRGEVENNMLTYLAMLKAAARPSRAAKKPALKDFREARPDQVISFDDDDKEFMDF